MRTIEERLVSAASETLGLADKRPVRPLPEQRPSPARGWLVFAAAFAVVVATFGLIPWLASNSQTPTPSEAFSGSPLASQPPTTLATAASCSASGVAIPSDQAGLPDTVAATRDALIQAAAGCDLDALELLAGDPFTASYGDSGFDRIAEREAGNAGGGLGDLIRLLDMSFGTIELDESRAIYVWPAAMTHEDWSSVPDAQVEELRQFYSDEDLATFEQFGGYSGWRVGILEDGSWLYYVGGD